MRGKLYFVLLISGLLYCAVGADIPVSHSEPATTVRSQMHNLVIAFRDLQPFIASAEAFRSANNRERIAELLKTLNENFHRVDEGASVELRRDSGFVANIEIVRSLLRDASSRFSEQRYGYAIVRLRALSQSCISCHTQLAVPVDFALNNSVTEKLEPEARAQFFAATRQFALAESEFLKAARSNLASPATFHLLRQWLVLAVRVRPNVAEAIEVLEKFSQAAELPASDRETIDSWIASLKRWKKEGNGADKDIVATREGLIRTGVTTEMFGDRGAIELLRASAMLHARLPKSIGEERAHILRLLGEAYSRLTMYFPSELPEIFLEQCIREFPGSAEARRAYRIYEQVMLLGFTGSAGTSLPSDIQATVKELHDIAYSVPSLEDRI